MAKKKVTKTKKSTKAKTMPGLVKVISVLYYIGSILGILFGILLISGSRIFGDKLALILGESGPGALIAGAVFILAISILGIFVAHGLWKGKNWARTIAIILAVLGVVGDIGTIAQGQLGSIVSLIINAFIAGYLWFNKDVKKYFLKK